MPAPTKKAKFSIENIIAPESPSYKTIFTSNLDLLSSDIDSFLSTPATIQNAPEKSRKRPSIFTHQYGTGDSQNAAKYIEKISVHKKVAKGNEKIPDTEDGAKYLEKIPHSDDIAHINEFQTVKYYSQFLIKSLPEDPEGLLAGVFNFCADEALNYAHKQFSKKPDTIGFTITSDLPDKGPVWAPIGPINENTIEAILNEFLKVAQSKWDQDVTLWGSPFTIEVCTINKAALPKKHRILGSGRPVAGAVDTLIKDKDLIKIQNIDNAHCLFYALQATLVQRVRKWHPQKFARYKNVLHGERKKKNFQKDTEALMHAVGAPLNKKEYDAMEWVPKVVEHWNRTYAGTHIFKVFIFKSIGEFLLTKPVLAEGPADFTTPIILYHTKGVHEGKTWGHFDGVTETGNLFKKPYCLYCQGTYDRPANHRNLCKSRCIKCSRMGPGFPCKATTLEPTTCQDCNKNFYNEECYEHHLKSNFCKHSKECPDCGQVWDNTEHGPPEGHVCGVTRCARCHEWHDKEKGCFIKPYDYKDKSPCVYIAFDFETTQFEDAGNGRRRHRPNFISAKIACTNCMDNDEWKNLLRCGSNSNLPSSSSTNLDGSNSDLSSSTKECQLCGPNRKIAFCEYPFIETNVDEQRVTDNPLEAFLKWLVEEMNHKNKIYAYSHNGGKFDMIFVFKLLRAMKINGKNLNPELIRRGNKLYELKVKGLDLYFRDSYNFFSKSLASLVPTFELDIQDKPYFPHLCNHPDNYGKDIFPTEADYMAGGFMPKKKKDFDQFFTENKLLPFRLEEQLAAYCVNDTDILMAALVKFRHEFMDISKRPADKDGLVDRAAFLHKAHKGLDPLREACTIAGACVKMFEANHLPYDYLPRVPERSYNGANTQSRKAHKYLQWHAEKHNVKIRSSYSAGGEKKVGPYRLDGWVEEQQLAIEIHGCAWHACPKCFTDDQYMLPNKRTVEKTRQKHNERMKYIRERIPNILEYWECEIRAMEKADPEMKKKFEEYEDYGPIHIRDCFYGGCTGPLQLYYKPAPGEKIYYYDVTSLYPYTNMQLDDASLGYPLGHPEVHILNEPVNWTKPEDNNWPFALTKVRVVPPRQCDVSVLPMRIEGDPRLLFPLCAKCAKLHPKGGLFSNNKKCQHNDRERSWISNCTSMELEEALREGYQVTEVFRVLEYGDSNKDLFRSYMREFLAEKIHATGFDKKIFGNKELEEKFILTCEEKFGIKIDREKMKTNKGRRELVKYCLNSLWGRFSMRNKDMMQTVITDDPAEFGEYLDRQDIDIYPPHEIAPGVIFFNFKTKEDWVEEHDSSNVTLSAMTTSYARLILLRSMQKIVRTPGCKLLYTDTDSVIFVAPEGQSPIELGDHIGDFTDEYPDHDILEAVFGGSKQYALKIRRKDDPNAPAEYVLKIRGITITHDAEHRDGLQYEKFKSMVLNYAQTGEPEKINIIYPHSFRRSILDAEVLSVNMSKIYKPFVGKGLIDPETLTVRDFGYSQ